MIELHANRRLFEMQMDYWGREGNPMRRNSCVRRVKDLPFGQKWAWISLNPNLNKGADHVQRFDVMPEIYVWGDEAYENVLCIISFIGFWQVFNFDPMFGQWAMPARAFIPTTAEDTSCYNTSGGTKFR